MTGIDWALKSSFTTRTSSTGSWQGALVEKDPVLATSFALLFLAKGRAPVLVNKLRHGPSGDWDNDPDDIRNIVNVVSHNWKNLLTWQVVDPAIASVPELLQAPDRFFEWAQGPGIHGARQTESQGVRRARGLHLRRGLLQQSRV